MHLTRCELTNLLKMAKAAHSKLPDDVINAPGHSWEVWYAGYVMDRLAELDMDDRWRALAAEPAQVVIVENQNWAPTKSENFIATDPNTWRPGTEWKSTNGNGPGPGCPPGAAQEATDCQLYRSSHVGEMLQAIHEQLEQEAKAADEQDARLSPPSPASGWR